MTKEEAIERACRLVDRAWKLIDPDAQTASDCFCRCGDMATADYRNDGKGIEFLERLLEEAQKK